jgi:hypothetical protein
MAQPTPRRTERAADQMATMMSDTIASPLHGGIEADSDRYLVHYFADRELARLDLDCDARIRAHQLAWLGSWRCWCPPMCLVYNLVCCSTLHMCTRFPTQERAVAGAHRLILRERTLLFEVDEHTVPAPQSDGSYFPTCCWPGGVCSLLGGPCGATCGDETHVQDRRTVIRLAEIDSIGIEPAGVSGCGCRTGPDHLVVTIRPTKDEEEALCMLGKYGPRRSGKVVAVIAGPKNGHAFAEEVRAQARRVVEERMDDNPPSPDVRDFDSSRAPVAPVRARQPTFAAVKEEPEYMGGDERRTGSTSSQPASDHDQDQEHTAASGFRAGPGAPDEPRDSPGADGTVFQLADEGRRWRSYDAAAPVRCHP